MTAELERTEICEGETTKLVVDTTGTGRVLHKELFTLKVTETTKAGDKTISLTPNRSTGKLESEVSPTSDAKYTVTYTYKVGGQDESKDLELTVHEKFQVEFSAVEPVCEGDQATVEVVKLYPSSTDLDWSDNPGGELISGSMSGASFMPAYTASGVAPQKKTYKAIAKNGICQDKPFMFDVYVHKPIDGEIRTADRICQFDELTLDASSYQAETYEWKYEEKDSVFTGMTATLVPDPDYATFTLNMTRGKCSAEVQKYVEVTSAPSVLQVDSIGIRQIEIQMETGLGTGEFKYIIDGNEDDPEIGSNIRDGLSYSEHVVKVVDEVGCSTEFRFVVNNPAIEIPNYISPNGDGVGDKFVVKGLAEGYPDAKVSIFDRWGKELATYNAGDGTDWDGVYNGVTMPSTDYWYEIQIKEIKKTYTGHFTLIRQ
jgi:gliding motility-associated-like protein